jgi:hypothetical protein
MKKESKEELRQSLDDLLGYDLPDEVPGLNESPNLPRIAAGDTHSQKLERAKTKATRVMDSLLQLYLSEEVIEEHEYIRAKKELDQQALTMLVRQMENSEKAIASLMDVIDEGEVAPRMFEVLSDLQRTMLEIIKSQTMYMVAVEENVKKVARDIDVYKGSPTDKKVQSGGGVKSRGTKDLMRALQDTLREEDVQDVEGVEDEDEE